MAERRRWPSAGQAASQNPVPHTTPLQCKAASAPLSSCDRLHASPRGLSETGLALPPQHSHPRHSQRPAEQQPPGSPAPLYRASLAMTRPPALAAGKRRSRAAARTRRRPSTRQGATACAYAVAAVPAPLQAPRLRPVAAAALGARPSPLSFALTASTQMLAVTLCLHIYVCVFITAVLLRDLQSCSRGSFI
jgi:hypothetical protein